MTLLEPGQQKELTLICKPCMKILDAKVQIVTVTKAQVFNPRECQRRYVNRGRYFVSEVNRLCRFCFRIRKAYIDLT